jgi:hypothetical protein
MVFPPFHVHILMVEGIGKVDDHSAIAVAPSGDVNNAAQEGLTQTKHCNEGFFDAGSLNSEEEQELEDYFKEIEEENRVEESKGQGETLSSAALGAILEASPRMMSVRRGKRRGPES